VRWPGKPAAQAKPASRTAIPPPPVRWPAKPAATQAKPVAAQAKPRGTIPPPPTRFGPVQNFAGRPGTNRTAQAAVVQRASIWNSLFGGKSSGSGNSGNNQQQSPSVALAPTVVPQREIVYAGEGFAAKKAYPLDTTVNYHFGIISGCTIVYARSATSGTAAHYKSQNHDPTLTTTMIKNVNDRDIGGTIKWLKIFFAAEAEQDHEKLTPDQQLFVNRIKGMIKRPYLECYVYDPLEATIMLNGDGSYVTDVSDKVTRATELD
jgi:hypothetical protein